MKERTKYILIGIVIGIFIGLVMFYLMMIFRVIRPFGFSDFRQFVPYNNTTNFPRPSRGG